MCVWWGGTGIYAYCFKIARGVWETALAGYQALQLCSLTERSQSAVVFPACVARAPHQAV